MNDRWQDRISEYLDGDLTPSESHRFEEHLKGCENCRSILSELRIVVGHAAQLPEPGVPESVWQGIQSRLASQGLQEPGAEVIELPQPAPKAHRILRPQWLMAAAVLLMFFSGAAGWFLRGTPEPTLIVEEPRNVIPSDLPPEIATALNDYEKSVAQLELALEQLADRMDPVSYESIQGNLVTIDRAIGEARLALSADPESEYLNVHLTKVMARKVRLLQQATRLASNQI